VWKDTLMQWNKEQDIPIWDTQNKKKTAGKAIPDPSILNSKESASNDPYKLYYGGNKSILVSVGEGQGAQVEQNLQLDVSGQLSENMWIRGHLSDQNIPIQPEGNTATLQEVDQIFLELYGKQYGITLGDFILNFGESSVDEFVDNVQGIRGWYRWQEYKLVQSLVRSRGQFHAYSFSGEYGRQSNYFLRGRDGREFITVLAGTEKVWKNGILLTRGKEYQIAYGEGRLDFLGSELLTENDEFSVEFQYTDREYGSILWAGSVSDTLGAWTWNLRGVIDNNSRTPLSGMTLSEQDLNQFKNVPDSIREVRTSGIGTVYKEENWISGLYTRASVDSPWVWIPQENFSQKLLENEEIYEVSFSLQNGGMYQKVSESQYVYQEGGGYAPGVIIDLPMRQSHYVVESKWSPQAHNVWGRHTSQVKGSLSEWDPNLYSSLQEEDNYGYGLQYNGTHVWGAPWNIGGVGQWDLQGSIEHKSEHYKPFRQTQNPTFYQDYWNVGSALAENNVSIYQLKTYYTPWSYLTFGGAWGTFHTPMLQSDRLRGEGILGGEQNFISGYIEEARTTNTIDTQIPMDLDSSGARFAQGMSFQVSGELGVLEGGYDRIERVRNTYDSAFAFSQNIEHEAKAHYVSSWYPLLKEKVKTSTSVKGILQESNFNGVLRDKIDSLILLEGSQSIEWRKVGVWNGNFRASWQDIRTKIEPTSSFQNQSYQLLEWVNVFRDVEQGYYFTSTYRFHPKIEIPLRKQFTKVTEGTGNYLCVESSTGTQSVSEDDCVLAGEKGGNYQLERLVRDTIRYRTQDLSWVGTLNYSPKNMPWKEWLFLEQWQFSLHFEFIKQDSSEGNVWTPPFIDRDVIQSASGKRSWQPSLQWRSLEGYKTFLVLWEDQLEKSPGTSRLTYSKIERSHYDWDINTTWSLDFRQFWETRRVEFLLNSEGSNGINSNRKSTRWGGGSSGTYRFWQWYRSILYIDYSKQFGTEGDVPFNIQDIYPRIRLERDWKKNNSTIGKVYGEYGWYSRWGTQFESIYLNNVSGSDFSHGQTHRFQLGVDLRLGDHIYCTGNYIARIEPSNITGSGGRSLFQKMTAEVQAVF
jgi:hypothetical protein